MKTIKYLLILIMSATTLVSCVEDNDPSALNDDGPNLVGFTQKSRNLSAVSNGEEYNHEVQMEVKGPTYLDLTDDVAVTVTVDASSTAIENTHFKLNTTSMILSKSNNYLGLLPITILTDGIIAPLPENPILVLNVASVNTNGNVVTNGFQIVLTLVYQCYADLAGTYLVTNDGCSMTPFLTTISANSDGSWFLTIGDGGFLGYGCTANPGLDNWANITELCGEILPTDDLQYAPCCDIGNISGGTWDPVTGVLTLSQSQDFTTNWAASWTSTYTRQ